jgi:hypothetical protein
VKYLCASHLLKCCVNKEVSRNYVLLMKQLDYFQHSEVLEITMKFHIVSVFLLFYLSLSYVCIHIYAQINKVWKERKTSTFLYIQGD